jgi:hypothetical protein
MTRNIGPGRGRRSLHADRRRARSAAQQVRRETPRVRCPVEFLLWRGRFPRALHELPDDAVAHLARQVRVPASELASFDLASRTAKRHRTEIRAYTGVRECRVTDTDTLTEWLAEHVAGVERREDRVREELLTRCRVELIEPPTPDRVTEITRSALHQAEQALLALIADRVDRSTVTRLNWLIAVSDDRPGRRGCAGADQGGAGQREPGHHAHGDLKARGDPRHRTTGRSVRRRRAEGRRGWRARAMLESPSHLREHPQPTKLALLCAPLVLHEREVTDTLAQLLISTIHRINAHAEKKVVADFVKAAKRRSATWQRVPRDRHGVPAQQAQGLQGLLHQPLPPRPDPPARGCSSFAPTTPRISPSSTPCS